MHIVNEGVAVHNLSISVDGITTPVLQGGETHDLTVNLPPGTYTIVCDVPGHRIAGMTGVLHVGE